MLDMITVVTPMRNEEETADLFMQRLVPSLERNSSKWRIIVPLTATDKTQEILDKYSVETVEVPSGLGRAYKAGLAKAIEEDEPGPVLTLDTDLSHLPEEMDRLIASDADLVLGARAETGSRFHRRMVSNLVNSILLGPYTDYTSSYRLYTRPVLKRVLPDMRSNGFAFMPEIVFRSLRAGFRVSQITVSFPPRVAGESKMSYRSNLKDYVRFLAWRYFG
jgi:dolichol-phosphate mannosyltransferase